MIDHKELRLWLQGQINKCREKDYNHWQNAKAEAFGQVIAHIDRERAKLQQAHERIDRARKSNAKPVDETFVFPLTVEEEASWNAAIEQVKAMQTNTPIPDPELWAKMTTGTLGPEQLERYRNGETPEQKRVWAKMFPDRSCLPCRSDEIED
jgi:hypothetical protein